VDLNVTSPAGVTMTREWSPVQHGGACDASTACRGRGPCASERCNRRIVPFRERSALCVPASGERGVAYSPGRQRPRSLAGGHGIHDQRRSFKVGGPQSALGLRRRPVILSISASGGQIILGHWTKGHQYRPFVLVLTKSNARPAVAAIDKRRLLSVCLGKRRQSDHAIGANVTDRLRAQVVEVEAGGLTWIKSTASNGQATGCVEVARCHGRVLVRCSRDRSGDRLSLPTIAGLIELARRSRRL
jgi:hypothetical protein